MLIGRGRIMQTEMHGTNDDVANRDLHALLCIELCVNQMGF